MTITFKEFKDASLSDKIDWIEYHHHKYRKMGYVIEYFRSRTIIYDSDNNELVHEKMSNHEFNAIDKMEKFLKKLAIN
jgi:hypothetical protein